MAGGLFDPKKMRGSPPPPAPSTPGSGRQDPISVSALGELIARELADRVPRPIRVVGEISGHRDRSHWYFDLKDENAVIGCIMFASAARKVGFPVSNGLKVVAEGRIDFYAPHGKVQLYVDRLTPMGAGELELRFRQLVAELRELGWFDQAAKKPLPVFPKRIAVVTSRSAAALQDVIDTARRRCPMVELALVDVRVQGEQAAPEIARAIGWLSANHAELGIDAIILTRGGGSMEDLWAFNERMVAEAVHRCALPIVAAIGHETDTTIAELVADERCATPTQAAMRLIPDRAALLEQIDAYASRVSTELCRRLRYESQRIRGLLRLPWLADPRSIIIDQRTELASQARHLRAALRHRVQHERIALSDLSVRIARGRPEAVYAARFARLDSIGRRLQRATRARLGPQAINAAEDALHGTIAEALESRRRRLDALERELILCGPEHVLRRGYTITTLADGTLLRSIHDAPPGTPISTRLVDGSIRSTVNAGADGEPGDAPPPGASAPAPLPSRPASFTPRKRSRKKRGRSGDNPNQLGLF